MFAQFSNEVDVGFQVKIQNKSGENETVDFASVALLGSDTDQEIASEWYKLVEEMRQHSLYDYDYVAMKYLILFSHEQLGSLNKQDVFGSEEIFAQYENQLASIHRHVLQIWSEFRIRLPSGPNFARPSDCRPLLKIIKRIWQISAKCVEKLGEKFSKGEMAALEADSPTVSAKFTLLKEFMANEVAREGRQQQQQQK